MPNLDWNENDNTYCSIPNIFQVRLNYHIHSATRITTGSLDLFIQYLNDTSSDNGYLEQYRLTIDQPMSSNDEGWQRWEATLPTLPQLR